MAPGGVYGQADTKIAKGTRGFFLKVVLDNCEALGYSPYVGEGTAIFHLVSNRFARTSVRMESITDFGQRAR